MVGGVGPRGGTKRRDRPRHRRDPPRATARASRCSALGLVTAVAVWAQAAGPIGSWLTSLLRIIAGNGAVLLPIVFVAGGLHLLRQAPTPRIEAAS